MSEPAARLWFGRTVHRREQPFERRFTHRIAMLEVDIDRLSEADRLSRLFAVDRGNAISFRQADHGARSAGLPLRAWAEARFAEAGVALEGGAIKLVSFPRVLGFGFAPISVWFGHGPDGGLRGVIYEVHNTFGEAHAYVSAFKGADVKERAGKAFHVSPFFDVDGDYRFTLHPPARGRMSLIVENVAPDGRAHIASLNLQTSALSTSAILRWLVGMPISGLGVLIAINWQALGLWIRGARYRPKPAQRIERTSLTRQDDKAASSTDKPRKRA